MTTVDIHMHLLNPQVRFNRFYDRLAIRFFAGKLGADADRLLADPYAAYCDTVVNRLRESRYLERAVIFGVDARVDEAGRELHRDPTVCAGNEAVDTLYRRAPELIIPFMSVNPLRPDALTRVEHWAARGFRGVKFLQNYWNVDLRQKRFAPFFRKLRELDLPLIIHIGSESSVHSYKECESLEMLEQPLSCGVTVIAAHMGLEYSPRHPIRALSRDPRHFGAHYRRLLEMLEEHDTLYADLSAILTPVRARALPHLARQTRIHRKLLFGTDFPVPYTTLLNTHDLPWRRRLELSRIANPFDRYVETLLEYFPEDHPLWSNYKKVLNL
ncbi:amidohydrolase family protein [Nitratifractor salsuginis]|uniref:Amidohydrolase 2 n=1 Tax=Nitratifractor salsuginis (strain DSM 16511 / JCM 12458 / E9I37-1) TaxID=749222 RepID=E6X2A0_NITSE|nr:amidohydrolase family protein [Nitratifractor salsuginis]ADV46035.1 amidohydrolase 2 [Nitratifractor salsuginis DSM 16511]